MTGAPRLGLQLLGVKVAVVDWVIDPLLRARINLRPGAAELLRQDFLNAPRQGLIGRARLRVATLLRQVENRFVARLFEGHTRRVLVARHVEELPAEPTGDATLKAALRRDEEIRFCVGHLPLLSRSKHLFRGTHRAFRNAARTLMHYFFADPPRQPPLVSRLWPHVGKFAAASFERVAAAVAFENKIAVLTIYHCFAPNICTAVFGT